MLGVCVLSDEVLVLATLECMIRCCGGQMATVALSAGGVARCSQGFTAVCVSVICLDLMLSARSFSRLY